MGHATASGTAVRTARALTCRETSAHSCPDMPACMRQNLCSCTHRHVCVRNSQMQYASHRCGGVYLQGHGQVVVVLLRLQNHLVVMNQGPWCSPGKDGGLEAYGMLCTCSHIHSVLALHQKYAYHTLGLDQLQCAHVHGHPGVYQYLPAGTSLRGGASAGLRDHGRDCGQQAVSSQASNHCAESYHRIMCGICMVSTSLGKKQAWAILP